MSTRPMNPSDTKTCAHPACSCPVQPGQKYCSQACENAPDKGLAGAECHCNHETCALAA